MQKSSLGKSCLYWSFCRLKGILNFSDSEKQNEKVIPLSPSIPLLAGSTAQFCPMFHFSSSHKVNDKVEVQQNACRNSKLSCFLLFKLVSVQSPREKFMKIYRCFHLANMAGFLTTPITNQGAYSSLGDSPQNNSE